MTSLVGFEIFVSSGQIVPAFIFALLSAIFVTAAEWIKVQIERSLSRVDIYVRLRRMSQNLGASNNFS